MKTVLVTGGHGQLATSLKDLASRFADDGWNLHAIGRPAFDFDRPATIEECLAAIGPALVVNAAAWTAVDLAETEVEAARRANETGPGRLAALCAEAGIPLIHVSTDYVFDGRKGTPYREADRANPLGVYGATKLAGEQRVLETGGRSVILRTSWLYGATGKNFVRTMLAAARRQATLRVVADQRGTPTNADDLATAILLLVTQIGAGWKDRFQGVFHATNTGDTTWHGLAEEIFAVAARFGWPRPEVTPIATEDWPTPAPRPADSRLDCGKLDAVFGLRMPDWRPSLARTVARLCRDEDA
jgi:dTDP-4-dehydrorhamnose reductase